MRICAADGRGTEADGDGFFSDTDDNEMILTDEQKLILDKWNSLNKQQKKAVSDLLDVMLL